MSLAKISAGDLAKLRDLVASRAVRVPLAEISLRASGFGDLSTSLATALPFGTSDVLLHVIDLVLDERAHAERPPLEFVWTGPDTTSPEARDTAVVLAELFRKAERRVLVAGYVFTQGRAILEPLHEALVRGVQARLFFNLEGAAASEADVPPYAARSVEKFVRQNWPFGAPYPTFFYDPRTARPDPKVLLHAKCAVVDGRHALVTSANFTGQGQRQHIEVGVLLDDSHFSSKLEGQFNALVAQGALLTAPYGTGISA